MSKQDIAIAKASVRDYLDSGAVRESVTPGEVARYVKEANGLDFSPTTIARYIQGCGWVRLDPPPAPAFYGRPS